MATKPHDDRVLPGAAFQSLIRAADTVSDDDLALINRLARTPLAPEDVFAFDCVPSTDRLDSYFTRQAPSSLANYAADALAGVAVMNSHRTGGWFSEGLELPLGRTFYGEVQNDGETQQLFAKAYLLRDYQPNPQGSANTNELIRGIQAGVISDLSIGFKVIDGAWYRCSICGNDMMRSQKCQHYPGYTYDGERAFAWVEGARLSEVSFVFDGATPGAVILKAQRAAEAGLLDRKVAGELEDLYQVRLVSRFAVPDLVSVKMAADPPEEGGDPVKGSELIAAILAAGEQRVGAKFSAATREALESIRAKCLQGHDNHDEAAQMVADLLATAEAQTNGDSDQANAAQMAGEYTRRIAELQQQLSEREARFAELERQVGELTSLAELGKQYRADLIEDTLKEGVRAQGQAFPEATYRGLLERSDLNAIKTLRASFEAAARERLGPGGRQTRAMELPTSAPMTPARPVGQYRD